MKESVISMAFKLQVAVKVVHDDEKTMKLLRKEAFEAKKDAIIANKRADSAVELVHALRLEINTLKRQIRNIKEDSAFAFATSSQSQSLSPTRPQLQSSMSSLSPLRQADLEVDEMMRRPSSQYQSRRRGRSPAKSSTFSQELADKDKIPDRKLVTPFQEWKMERFLWSPDTPQASEYRDREVVEALASVALRDTSERRHKSSSSERTERGMRVEDLARPIVSSAAKTRPALASSSARRRKDVDDVQPAPPPVVAALLHRRRQERTSLPVIDRTSRALNKLRKANEHIARLISTPGLASAAGAEPAHNNIHASSTGALDSSQKPTAAEGGQTGAPPPPEFGNKEDPQHGMRRLSAALSHTATSSIVV